MGSPHPISWRTNRTKRLILPQMRMPPAWKSSILSQSRSNGHLPSLVFPFKLIILWVPLGLHLIGLQSWGLHDLCNWMSPYLFLYLSMYLSISMEGGGWEKERGKERRKGRKRGENGKRKWLQLFYLWRDHINTEFYLKSNIGEIGFYRLVSWISSQVSGIDL